MIDHATVTTRYNRIALKRAARLTLKEIARDEGISIARVQQILDCIKLNPKRFESSKFLVNDLKEYKPYRLR